MRVAALFVLAPLLVSGQETRQSVPADRRADTYAIYSAVLSRPGLSHPDNNRKYIIVDLSGIPMEQEPVNCIAVPEPYRAAFQELLADRAEHRKERYRLERAFHIGKPYDLITETQANQFGRGRFGPGPSPDEPEMFRGAVDLLTLGNVYFDRKRTVAAVYTAAVCGSLCGLWQWRVYFKTGRGDWSEQQWITCATVAAARSARPPRAL